MITLGQASKEIFDIINKYLKELEEKYIKVDLSHSEQGVFLTCHMKNNEKITLRAIEDNDRKSFTPPKNSKEHQEQGGHRASIEKIKRTNPNAWKIEVKQTIKNKIMEIGFSGSEVNWSPSTFESAFVSTIINKI
ncbi:hypothetical protein MNBD_GAMMA08-2359 [hydrothermal vent metagenome]|uniref:Uncharacterized protein n=1 Tax=hydrothermal vent metagenome TaxID=652676 RepID=A0A3B0XFQ5_9ZZZZ